MRARRVAVALVALGALVALVGCGDDGPDRPVADRGSTTEADEATTATTEERTTGRDYTATTGPDCTRGTIPEGTPIPPGCDRLYSPFLSPGRECTAGQHPDCVDPDGDGGFTYIFGGGTCLVERKDPDRCLDRNGDGVLDEPLPG